MGVGVDNVKPKVTEGVREYAQPLSLQLINANLVYPEAEPIPHHTIARHTVA